MKIELNISRILIYYDFPELFLANDNVGTKYLCLLTKFNENSPEYVCLPVSNSKLASLISGEIDLREAFINPETGNWFYINSFNGESFEASRLETKELQENLLPEEGFLYPQIDESNKEIVTEVQERENTIVHLSLADSKNSYSIEADVLADYVKLFQGLVRKTYKKTISKLGAKSKKLLDQEYNYNLRAFATSKGSLNIHFYGTAQKDIFGNTELERALSKIDKITQDFSDEEEYIELLRSIKGHPISSYRKLIERISKENVRVKYKWYSPGEQEVHYRELSKTFAEKVLEILNQKDELIEEIKEFVGVFKQADVTRGNWRIHNSEDNKEYSGVSEGRKLEGITLETMEYKAICEEIIVIDKVTEREKVEYRLVTIEENQK